MYLLLRMTVHGQSFPEVHLYSCNVFSGEGKSCIVAMLATVLGIRGAHVDVISSSPMLARRDAEEWIPFFKKFHLSTGVAPAPRLNELSQEEALKTQRENYQVSV